MNSLLITGTDTGVGKTFVAATLIRQLQRHLPETIAYKPVCSGAIPAADGGDTYEDLELLSSACGNRYPKDVVCPQRFRAPVAPNESARLQNSLVDDQLLVTGFDECRKRAEFVLVEGAGGLLCPLSDATTVASLAQRLSLPLVIVAANRLGVLNHTLLTVEVAAARGLSVLAVVLNDVPPDVPADTSRQLNAAMLHRWLPALPVYLCRCGGSEIARTLPDGHTEQLADRIAAAFRMKCRSLSTCSEV